MFSLRSISLNYVFLLEIYILHLYYQNQSVVSCLKAWKSFEPKIQILLVWWLSIGGSMVVTPKYQWKKGLREADCQLKLAGCKYLRDMSFECSQSFLYCNYSYQQSFRTIILTNRFLCPDAHVFLFVKMSPYLCLACFLFCIFILLSYILNLIYI